MLARFLNASLLLILFSGLFVASCTKDDEIEILDTQETSIDLMEDGTFTTFNFRPNVNQVSPGPGDRHGDRRRHLFRCFKLIFPVTIVFPDEMTMEVADFEELSAAIRTWRQNNPDAGDRPRIAFPHSVELPGGTVLTVENAEELQNLIRRCAGLPNRPHVPRNHCFEVVFPVTLAFPDGSTTEVGSREEYAAAIQAWVESNPDATARPKITFPYSIELSDGTVISVNDSDELREVIASCLEGRPFLGRKCFDLVFPLTVAFPDGSTQEVEDREALRTAITAWLEANPDATERPQIAYPYSVEFEDGTVVTIEGREQLLRAAASCREDRPHHERRCFKVVFPITLSFPDGTTAQVNDRAEMVTVLREWKAAHPDATERPKIAFPYSIEFRDGTVVTVDSQEELRAAAATCREDRPINFLNRCYELVFPVTLKFPDGTTTEVEDRAELLEAIGRWVINHPRSRAHPEIVFPYNIQAEDGTVITVESREDLREAAAACREDRPQPGRRCYTLVFPKTLEFPGGV